MIKENQLRVTEIKEEVSNIRGLINRCKRQDTIMHPLRTRQERNERFIRRSEAQQLQINYLLEATGALYNIQE